MSISFKCCFNIHHLFLVFPFLLAVFIYEFVWVFVLIDRGSIGWGSRPSSSASNPWGSSTLSPNADGSASSPSQLSGRPSSAGSGSRPSTAGSERTLERPANAWGPSSRPSSASGVLPSTQTSTSLRPHSAETRPSSSQLSRFAEPVSDSSLARGPSGTAERMVCFYYCTYFLVLVFMLLQLSQTGEFTDN